MRTRQPRQRHPALHRPVAPEGGQGQQHAQPEPRHDSGNREHVWPKSHGFPSEGQLAHTDIHHLRPADVTCNSDRGNLDLDESELAHPECASRREADSFEPRDAVKGEIARMLFYMDVRYAGGADVPDLALIDEDSRSGPLLGHLCTLLAWHHADPVDDLERRRHERIVETQGNPQPLHRSTAIRHGDLERMWRELGPGDPTLPGPWLLKGVAVP